MRLRRRDGNRDASFLGRVVSWQLMDFMMHAERVQSMQIGRKKSLHDRSWM